MAMKATDKDDGRSRKGRAGDEGSGATVSQSGGGKILTVAYGIKGYKIVSMKVDRFVALANFLSESLGKFIEEREQAEKP